MTWAGVAAILQMLYATPPKSLAAETFGQSYTQVIARLPGDDPAFVIREAGVIVARARRHKTILGIRLDVYDPAARPLVAITTHWLSLGSMWAWGAQLHVHGGSNTGSIRGALYTANPAEFSLYGAEGFVVAVATLSADTAKVLVSTPVAPRQTIVAFEPCACDLPATQLCGWRIVVHDNSLVGQQLLWALGTWIADHPTFFAAATRPQLTHRCHDSDKP